MTISKVLYTLRGATRFMLPQFFRKSDGEPVLLEGDKGVFVQMVDSTGDVIGTAKPLPVQVIGESVENQGPIEVPLQDNATVPNSGMVYTPTDGKNTLYFEVTGTSTSRTIAFEIIGSNGEPVSITAFSTTDPSISDQYTTGGSDETPEYWVVQIPIGCSFRANITAVSGGNVNISGKAVA
ncbi:hypothetical protein ACLNAR_26490 [Priestia aryabhattai]|uniref:hypothetical protein n=1 Tax=Priestia aryabhattai TaxID=412384 RepID=UPI00398E3D03